MPRSPRSKVLLVGLGLLAACGGGEPPVSQETETPAPDTLIRTTIPREPLTAADLVGFSMAEVSVELPWTTNRVSRGGNPQAARARLQSVGVSGHEGFDRVLFEFSETAPFPGYEIELGILSASLECAEDQIAPDLGEAPGVVIRILPSRIRDGDEVSVPLGVGGFGMARFQEGGLVCEDQEGLVWAAALAEGTQVRALELRSPNRLVVDIR